MIHKLRIPQSEPFSFIEYEYEGERDDATDEYHRLTEVAKGDKCWEDKDFNLFMENMVEGKPNQVDPGLLDNMSTSQKYLFNFNRKMLGRLDNRNKR
jgi:hypothetical protein